MSQLVKSELSQASLAQAQRWNHRPSKISEFTCSCPSYSRGVSGLLLSFTCYFQESAHYLSYMLTVQCVSCNYVYCLIHSFSSDLTYNPYCHWILPAATLHWRLQTSHHPLQLPSPNLKAPPLSSRYMCSYREVIVGLAGWISYMAPQHS